MERMLNNRRDVEYCCPGHTPPRKLDSGDRRAQERRQVRREIDAEQGLPSHS